MKTGSSGRHARRPSGENRAPLWTPADLRAATIQEAAELTSDCYFGGMEHRAVQTPFGEVWLQGRTPATESEKPLVLVIGGAFQAENNSFLYYQPAFPEAEIVFSHLPGNHCPELSEVSVDTYAAAYEHVLAKSFPSRHVILCGVSIGALVSLAIQSSAVHKMVLLEPPLVTAKLWPLIEPLRRRAAAAEWAQRFVQAVFGYFPAHIEDRDYRPLLSRLRVPAQVLLGGVPLMPERSVMEIPSLLDNPERDLIAAHPLVQVSVAPNAGHNLPKHAQRIIVAALHEAIWTITEAR